MADWTGRTATEIAIAVRAGQASARDVVAEHLDRIAAIDGELGAFVRVRAEAALREAGEVDSRPDRGDLPLAGVPVAIKDNIPVTGEPMRVGSLATPDTPQERDHPLVERLRGAGAVIVGLTSLPEFAIFPFTDGPFGVARNPWDRRRTPGGSSGGSAAAVASAMVPLAVGNDGLGSVRIPAAACGLFGIKPGPGVVPAEVGADSWSGILENGPLTTTVADAALALGVLAGTTFELTEPRALRIAVSVKPTGPGIVVHRGLKAAVRRSGEALATLGHTVEPADPRYPAWVTPAVIARWLTAPAADAAPYLSGSDLSGPGVGRRARRHFQAGRLLVRGRGSRERDRERLQQALAPFFDRFDVLAMPSLAWTCPPARRWSDGSWLRSVVASLRFAPMTGVWNLAGFPAASVPAGSVGGMPGSVQLVAAPGKEALLLAVAAQLEQAAGWRRHAPGYDPAG